eukprot:g8518.t1
MPYRPPRRGNHSDVFLSALVQKIFDFTGPPKTVAAVLMSQNVGNKVVIIGGSSSGKKFLLRKLIGQHHLDEIASHTGVERVASFRMIVDNKYYRAQLDIWSVNPLHATTHKENVRQNIGKDCQALLFIYDLTEQSSWHEVEKWGSFISEHSPAVLLLIGNAFNR